MIRGDSHLEIACPWCGAKVGVGCTVLGKRLRQRACHHAREEAAHDLDPAL